MFGYLALLKYRLKNTVKPIKLYLLAIIVYMHSFVFLQCISSTQKEFYIY